MNKLLIILNDLIKKILKNILYSIKIPFTYFIYLYNRNNLYKWRLNNSLFKS